MFVKRMRLIMIFYTNVSTCDYWGDEVQANDRNGGGSTASSCSINLNQEKKELGIAPPCLIKYQYARESSHGTWPIISPPFITLNSMSVVIIAFLSLKYELDIFNTRSTRMHSMAPPSMSKPFLLSAHSLLSTCFLLSVYFLAVHSYKCMRLTTSVYGTLLPQ